MTKNEEARRAAEMARIRIAEGKLLLKTARQLQDEANRLLSEAGEFNEQAKKLIAEMKEELAK